MLAAAMSQTLLTAISIKNRKIYYRCLINRVVTFFFNYCFIVFDIYRRQKYEQALSKDDIYNLVLLAYQLNGFISEILVCPDLLAV
jgi:hypothetical protein